MDQITVVVGAQWGDEGKGKITDFYADKVQYVVRFQGGNNAGHTIVVGDETYKLHLLPSGVISSNTVNIVGNGVVVNPQVILDELQGLHERGITPKFLISERAHVIMPYHIAMDEALSGHQGNLGAGSTKRGIAPVYADKAYRHGIRMGDLLDKDLFREKLEKAYAFNTDILQKVFEHSFDRTFETIYQEYLGYGTKLAKHICDTELELHKAFTCGQYMLFEGAQGMSLDPDHGMYPHTTSSNNVAGYCEVGAGVGFNTNKKVIGVVKAYVSRVGNSPFITELHDELGNMIREKGNEYGTTTGRSRRVGWLDLVQIRQSVRCSGLTDIAMTKLDILNNMKEIKICVGYLVDGKITKEMPASLSVLREATPMYKTFAGWENFDIAQVKRDGFESLPAEMKEFILYVEREGGCKISIVSFGPKREDTILR